VQGRGDGVAHTIEFETRIQNGTIHFPRRYRRRLQEQGADNPVRVIIYLPGQEPGSNYVDWLLTNPIHVENFYPLDRDEIPERS
jgi:hypothetical protein